MLNLDLLFCLLHVADQRAYEDSRPPLSSYLYLEPVRISTLAMVFTVITSLQINISNRKCGPKRGQDGSEFSIFGLYFQDYLCPMSGGFHSVRHFIWTIVFTIQEQEVGIDSFNALKRSKDALLIGWSLVVGYG
ncbi:hypothetical protein L1987_84455 [Smallanthus sonchifolius]|uniref:Uncharacterized protein n=1 Tax=Smallanthus sonchifolius TaxID=185202 RepID=A0ACB8YER3_9ASTR|nr:hypothetical protein L1987_84455 [Smallanthus sonchifolius]